MTCAKPEARTTPPASILAFFLMMLIAATPALAIDYGVRSWLRGHSILRLLLAVSIVLPVSLVSCRLFLRMSPLPIGEIEPRSRSEFAYCVYMPYCLLVLPIPYMSLFPIPLRCGAYILLGMRAGKKLTFPAGSSIRLSYRWGTTWTIPRTPSEHRLTAMGNLALAHVRPGSG
jgi:hypothetical protein